MRSIVLGCLLSCFTGNCLAQLPSFFSKIECDTIPRLYLTLDWKTLMKTKREKAYQDAALYCREISPTPIQVDAKIRTRGHMRLEICEFPPLKLKLDPDDLGQLQLSDLNEMDIVHHCEQKDGYSQLLLKEFLAYKLWELISPLHFRTQLIELHYLNPDARAAFEPTHAFLLEDEDEFVHRVGARRIKSTTMHRGALDKASFLRVCLFQFMIGNTDWYITNSHNLEFFGMPDMPMLQVVPYDFDYSGLVNAPYAAHHESIKLTATSMRFYQGWCHTTEEVNEQLKIFKEQKQAILAMPSTIPGMDERSIRYTTEYLQSFFDIIENPKKLESQVIKHCDMWPVKN